MENTRLQKNLEPMFLWSNIVKKNIKYRIFSHFYLSEGNLYTLNEEQAHYLLHVLRLQTGDVIKIFDGFSGEYLAEIVQCNKKNCQIQIKEKLRKQSVSPDIWLLFAPVKKDKTDFIISGATELGVSKILPVITQRTVCERIKIERFQAQVIEAAEQSRRLDIPSVENPISFAQMLKTWPKDRTLFFMDETGNGTNILNCFQKNNTKSAILVGPEGGFSEEELALLRQQNFAQAVSLGPRILRAETAVLAALSCWQAASGDW